MSGPIIALDRSDIQEGKLDELKAGMDKLADFVEVNEARPISYNVYFDDDGTHMSVLQEHPDSASMELHMRLAGPLFQEFAHLVELRSMEIFGVPSDALLEQINHKIEVLGTASVVVYTHRAGFTRAGED